MKLFELRSAGPEAGDCTAPYDVEFYKECTVREFIDEVLKKDEWGFIRIFGDGPSIEYKCDRITYGDFGSNILDSKINRATAHGGWTRMEYMLDIQPGERTILRGEYAQTLKEIVRHESEIAKLKKKAHDIEEQLQALENSSCSMKEDYNNEQLH